MESMYDRNEVADRALRARTNDPGTCQLWTRTMAGGASVGDVDHDGDADAVDGWKQSTHKHPANNKDGRKPPRGTIVSYGGGRHGFGHRAISLGEIDGEYMIRSTDAPQTGRVGTVPIYWFEREWGLQYLGWSDDISGLVIPLPPGQPKPKKTSRGVKVDEALKELKLAKGKGERRALLDRAIESLTALPYIK